MTQTMKHGDSKQQFDTGAQRDTQTGKLRYDLISPFALQRLAKIYTKGAEHYGDRNWEKGIPFTRMCASLMRHTMQFLMGDQDEDHLAQAAWNAVGMLHFQEMIDRGNLPASLNDMPDYRPGLLAAAETPAADYKPPFQQGTIQDDDFQRLLAMGCPTDVAEQIVKGTTYTGNDNRRDCSYSNRYVYIAGPMRGYAAFNFPAFDNARDALVHKGFNVISPADIDRSTEVSVDPADMDVTDQTRFVFRDFWAIYFLKKIDSGQNGLALLDNWFKSTGATSEFGLAKWLDLVFYESDGSGHYFANGGKCPKDFQISSPSSTGKSDPRVPLQASLAKYGLDWPG